MNAAEERFVVGTPDPPAWVCKAVTPFRRMDGTTGLELWTDRRVAVIYPGDALVKQGEKIKIIKQEKVTTVKK